MQISCPVARNTLRWAPKGSGKRTVLFQAHHRSSEAAQQCNALHAKVKDLSRGVLPTQPSSCCSTPRIHKSSPVPCSPQVGGQSSFTDRYVETNRRRQQNSVLTKGQVITPVQCLAWRPRLTCQRPYSPSASSPTPGQGQPSRARCRQGQGQQGLGAAGCRGQQWGRFPNRLPPPAPSHDDDGPQTGEKREGTKFWLEFVHNRRVFSKNGVQVFLKLNDLRAGLRLAEAGLPEVNG